MQEKSNRKKRRREMRQAEDGQQGEPRCTQCGQEVAPLEALLSPVCGRCVRKNHRRAVDR